MPPEDPYVLYTAERVLHVDPVALHTAAGVLVHAGTIAWVGPVAEFPAATYPSVTRRDLGDVTLMPGMIDAHVHLGFDGGSAPVRRMRAESTEQQAMLMLRSARELLSVGVTTARDLGSRGYLSVAVRQAIEEGTARGPRILAAGAPLTVTGGHCWFMGGEVDDEHEARKLVRGHHKNGVDLIKVMSTGGFMTPGSAPWHTQFTGRELRMIVEEAHRLAKPVAAHCHGVDGIRRAVAVGVDTLEHCTFVRPDGAHEVVPEIADAIAESSSYVSPTMNAKARTMMASGAWEPPVADLYRRGAKIIMSTDAGIDGTPHHDYVAAVVSLVDAGLPVAEVISAATCRAAQAMGLGHVTGRLAIGLSADLIAVGGDPISDPPALRDLRLVVARGHEFTPDPLPSSARLATSEVTGVFDDAER